MRKSKEEIIEEMQAVADQMYKDDIEENPSLEEEFFDCDCCGKNKCLAGSIQYGDYRLCNDCVVLAETGFTLGKFDNIQLLIDAMEDTRLANDCEFIRNEELKQKFLDN